MLLNNSPIINIYDWNLKILKARKKRGGATYSIHQSFLCPRIHVAAEWHNLRGNNNILISDWLESGITRDSYDLGREHTSVFPRLLNVYVMDKLSRLSMRNTRCGVRVCELIEMHVSQGECVRLESPTCKSVESTV